MSDYLTNRWEEQRKSLLEQLRAIQKDAEDNKRDITAEEMAQVSKISEDMEALRSQIDRVAEVRKLDAEAERALAGFNVDGAAPKPTDEATQLRAFLKGEVRSFAAAPESRDLASGTASAGGNTIARGFYDRLVEHLVETSGVLMSGPTVFTTANGESFDVPITTSHGAAGQEVSENSAIPESDPAFGKRTLGAYTYSQLVQVPNGLIQDTAVDLTGYLARACGRNVGLALAPRLVTGTGSSQPSGILVGATLGTTGATGKVGAFSYDDLVNLYHSVIAPYRNSPSAGWIMKDSSLAAVRLLKDGAGSYIFAAGTAGQPDTILGKPVHTDPNVAGTAVSAKSVIFGDISTYWVRYAGPVRFERSDDYAFGTDQVSFRCILRADAVLVDQTGAVKYFAGAAS